MLQVTRRAIAICTSKETTVKNGADLPCSSGITSQPTNAKRMFFTLDTDVLVLVIANYESLLKDAYISVTSGILQVRQIWTALGADHSKALPAFHALLGGDNVGRFARIGKVTWFDRFLKADYFILQALHMLSPKSEATQDQISNLARFVCAAYLPKGVQIDNMAYSDNPPPTCYALNEHILSPC